MAARAPGVLSAKWWNTVGVTSMLRTVVRRCLWTCLPFRLYSSSRKSVVKVLATSLYPKPLHWLPVKRRIEFKLWLSSSHQQTGTCLPTEPADNYCICAWSGFIPLGQQHTTLSSSQPHLNLVNAPSPLRLESASYLLISNHHEHSCFYFFRGKLKIFF